MSARAKEHRLEKLWRKLARHVEEQRRAGLYWSYVEVEEDDDEWPCSMDYVARLCRSLESTVAGPISGDAAMYQ